MKRILLLNGPNMNMLGIREPDVYGHVSLADLEHAVRGHASALDVQVECLQSNHEGAIIDAIHAACGEFDGIVFNPAAHTHYSYAIRDALTCIDVPCVEVHLSDIDAREPFRSISVIAPACAAQVKGLGIAGYLTAVDLLCAGVSGRLGEGFAESAVGKMLVCIAGGVVGFDDVESALARLGR